MEAESLSVNTLEGYTLNFIKIYVVSGSQFVKINLARCMA